MNFVRTRPKHLEQMRILKSETLLQKLRGIFGPSRLSDPGPLFHPLIFAKHTMSLGRYSTKEGHRRHLIPPTTPSIPSYNSMWIHYTSRSLSCRCPYSRRKCSKILVVPTSTIVLTGLMTSSMICEHPSKEVLLDVYSLLSDDIRSIAS